MRTLAVRCLLQLIAGTARSSTDTLLSVPDVLPSVFRWIVRFGASHRAEVL